MEFLKRLPFLRERFRSEQLLNWSGAKLDSNDIEEMAEYLSLTKDSDNYVLGELTLNYSTKLNGSRIRLISSILQASLTEFQGREAGVKLLAIQEPGKDGRIIFARKNSVPCFNANIILTKTIDHANGSLKRYGQPEAPLPHSNVFTEV